MGKPTPGPWTFIWPSCVRIGTKELHPGNGPDASLIAAAPDLLAALEQCEDLLSELADGGAENPELEVARAALAKARGES